MRTPRLLPLAVLALACVLLPAPADAALRLGLGADYWTRGDGVFGLTLAADTPVARRLAVGGRFGALVATPNTLGVPLDLLVRVGLDRVYLEAMAGPWILFGSEPLRAHAAFGFGIKNRAMSLGLEVGWLDPKAIVGLRVAWRL